MSELMQCNYCTLQWYKKIAEEEQADIVLRPNGGTMGGMDLFIVPEGKALSSKLAMIYPSRDFPDGNKEYAEFHRAWFMGFTLNCAC